MGDSPLRLLLVEDEGEYAWILQEDMRRHSPVPVEVHHVSTLSDALDALDGSSVDGAILDLMLPDSRGIETFLALRRKQPELPVVVMTGMQDESVALAAMESGAQDYLYKGDLSGVRLVQALRWGMARERSKTLGAAEGAARERRLSKLSVRLREIEPDKFAGLVSEYSELLVLAVQRWVYKSEEGFGEHLKSMTSKLCALDAGPRDITDLHTAALQEIAPHETPARAKSYIDQGRLLALHLMGNLASYYREQALGRRDP